MLKQKRFLKERYNYQVDFLKQAFLQTPYLTYVNTFFPDTDFA